MNQIIISEFNNLINTLLYEKPSNYSFKINSFKKLTLIGSVCLILMQYTNYLNLN